jgi:hypothetical protein
LLTQSPKRGLLLEPFKSYTNDAEGRAFARSHHLEFPYSNDTHDASIGGPVPFALDSGASCTGVITVGYRGPLRDHPVVCSEFPEAVVFHGRISVAVWRADGEVVQLSELYRP